MNEKTLYKKVIETYPVLTQEQEVKMFNLYKNGNEKEKSHALEMLVNSNLRLVMNLAVGFVAGNAENDDLIQEGCRGVQHAITMFDPAKGFKFSTYATFWIKQYMSRYIKGLNRTVHIPEHIINIAIQVKKFEHSYETEYGKLPTLAETSDFLKLEVGAIKTAKKAVTDCKSMNSAIGDDGSVEFGELIPDSKDSSCAIVEKSEATSIMQRALKFLSKRDRDVLKMRYGLQ